MDQQGLFAVDDLDVRLRYTGLELKNGVGIETESFEDAIDLGILKTEYVSVLRLLATGKRSICRCAGQLTFSNSLPSASRMSVISLLSTG